MVPEFRQKTSVPVLKKFSTQPKKSHPSLIDSHNGLHQFLPREERLGGLMDCLDELHRITWGKPNFLFKFGNMLHIPIQSLSLGKISFEMAFSSSIR